MKIFIANKVDEKVISLNSPEKLAELWKLIEASENFIVTWKEGADVLSEVMIASNLVMKVKSGEIILCARSEVSR